MSDWVGVDIGLRQGCVISSWIFNMRMDGDVREKKNRVNRRGLKMIG